MHRCLTYLHTSHQVNEVAENEKALATTMVRPMPLHTAQSPAHSRCRLASPARLVSHPPLSSQTDMASLRAHYDTSYMLTVNVWCVLQEEIAATASRLTALRSHEQVIRDRLLKLESDRRAILAIDTKVKRVYVQCMCMWRTEHT